MRSDTLAGQYSIINRAAFIYSGSSFSAVSTGLRREESVLNIKGIIRDIYNMEVDLEYNTTNLRISITLRPPGSGNYIL